MINLIVFIISLKANGLEPSQKGEKLIPSSIKTFELFGSLWGTKIRESFLKSYRWITNSALHGNLEHPFPNSLGDLFFAIIIEHLIENLK